MQRELKKIYKNRVLLLFAISFFLFYKQNQIKNIYMIIIKDAKVDSIV